MIFNLEDYKDPEFAMHCPDEDSAEIFTMYLHKRGRTWTNGESYNNNLYFGTYAEKTAYSFNRGTYGNVDYYKESNYHILNFYDFEWEEPSENQGALNPPMSFDTMFYGETQ